MRTAWGSASDSAAAERRVSPASLSALYAVLGESGVEQHEPVFIDGEPFGITLRPADGDALAATLSVLSRQGLSAVVRGGGTQLGFGNPPRGADLLLSTAALSAVIEFDALDGVVHAGAGTEIASLAALAATSGWELPIEPCRPGATIGGALAVGASGPRRLGLGRARDCVLGMSTALPSGERTSCGGRVVKNVTGYDLQKLYTGSLGTLGVTLSAWLRLRPAPRVARVRCLVRAGDAPDAAALAFSVDASRRSSARAIAWVSPEIASRHRILSGSPAWALVAEYAGDEPSVAEDVAWLEESGRRAGLLSVGSTDEGVGSTDEGVSSTDDGVGSTEDGVGSTEDGIVERLRAAQSEGVVRARIAVLPSALGMACAPLLAAGVGLVVHAGTGLVYAISHEPRIEAVLAAVDAAVARTGGEVRFEELPQRAKSGRDVFGDPGPRLSLLRSLKQQFDPLGTLNRGRFQGFV